MPFSIVMAELKHLFETESMTSFVKAIISKCEIMEQYNTNSDEDVDRKANIEQLVQSISVYEKNNPTATLSDYLESVTLENNIEESDSDGDNISISTVHASKGLEFDYVYIIGAEEGCFPLSRALDDAGQLEEERRLMYVAITRAKKHLVITRAKSRFLYGNRSYTTESRFLKEMNLTTMNFANNSKNYYAGDTSAYGINYSYSKTPFAPTVKKDLDSSMNFIGLQAKKLKEQNKFSDYKINSKVSHPKFGIGRIVGLENVDGSIYASCQFDKFGVKKLSLDFAPLQLIK
jgi:DNA helicase-2/ATP-dependent DNA helicase PcrA